MTDKDNTDDEERAAKEEAEDSGLAALARPSGAPPADEEEDDDDGVLDLRALASSMAPPAPAEGDDESDDGVLSTAPAKPAEADEDEAAEAKGAEAKSSGKKAGAVAKTQTSGGAAVSGKKDEGAKAPVAPIADEPSGGGGKILVGLVVVVAVGAIAFAMTRQSGGDELVADANTVDTAPAENGSEPAAETEAAEASEEAPAETETETEVETVDEASAETVDEDEASSESAATQATARRDRSPSTSNTSAMTQTSTATAEPATDEPTMEAAPETEEPEESSAMGSVEDLLDRAIGGNAPPPTMEAEPTMEASNANLPETPSRAAVTRALGGLMSRMRQCAGDQVGIATARIRVSNNGQVQSANIGGRPFGGTPQGDCMEQVVKTARFPRFTRSHFDVTYPFSIRPLN